MAEFASAGVGNAGLTTGIIGTALGFLNSGGLGGIFGGGMGMGNNPASLASVALQLGDHYATKEDLKYARELAEKDSEISLLKSEQNTEIKISDVYERLIRRINQDAKEQADWNAAQSVNNAHVSAAIATNAGSIAALQSVIGGITKTVVPKTAICPEPMDRYNSWTAPTASTGG